MARNGTIDRRSFVAGAVAAGGGMALGFRIPFDPPAARANGGAAEINVWIVIRPDDTVIVRVARAEMGQGVFTALPMLVAEELECDWTKVKAEFVSPSENFARGRAWGDMSTGASRSISASQEMLRRAGATAREMLIAAAAQQWNVPARECRAAGGAVSHPSGRRATFGALAAAAAAIPPPPQVRLKGPKEWTLIGKPHKRFDVLDKVTGKTVYAADVRLPGMLFAAIVQCPVFKGTVRTVDSAKAGAMNGVRHIVVERDFVAAVADGWWQAKKAADALAVTWNDGNNGLVSSETIRTALREGLAATHAGIARNDGDIAAGFARAARHIAADYMVPYLAHATMEPQNCTAHVGADRVEIFVPTQDAEAALSIAAVAAGVERRKVVVHRMMLGGGFGRRGAFQDYVRQAVLIAKHVGRPVQLQWSREEDMRHDFYRPMVMARLAAGLDEGGMPTAWSVRIAGQSIAASIVPELMGGTFDKILAQGFLADMPYPAADIVVAGTMHNNHVPVGPWRGLDYTQNAFFRESFVDELAHAARQDPYLYRRRLLAGRPRHLAVLDAAARKAGWGSTAPAGIYRGIAINEASGSVCAQVVEASIAAGGTVAVHRVVSALDAGHAVNPLTIELQTQSAIVYGLTAALYGEITIKNGCAQQSNFHDYEMLRMADMPRVETVIMESPGIWGGVGELPLSPLAPALCNAVFAATGKRIRSLPLKNEDLV
jgi:isoquinoline 1-oxidoreductase beta subunit